MDPELIREETVQEARRLGYEVSSELPLLDFNLRLRDEDEVARRCLARYAAVAVAYGFDRGRARDWLKCEGLAEALATSERDFLDGQDDVDPPKAGVESLWALCWALGFVASLDFGQICGDELISLFPDLRAGDEPRQFFTRARLRPLAQIAAAVDLAYCIHWSITQTAMSSEKGSGQVPVYVIVERRRTLEWLVGDESWDRVSLDT